MSITQESQEGVAVVGLAIKKEGISMSREQGILAHLPNNIFSKMTNVEKNLSMTLNQLS